MWGLDASSDIPRHVAGAIQLFKLRYKNSAVPRTAMWPFSRLMIESILYQEFMVTSTDPFSSKDTTPDWEFWAWAEGELDDLRLPYGPDVANSPVLGVPLSLYILILKIIHFCRDPLLLVEGTEEEYWRMRMSIWEATLGTRHPAKLIAIA